MGSPDGGVNKGYGYKAPTNHPYQSPEQIARAKRAKTSPAAIAPKKSQYVNTSSISGVDDASRNRYTDTSTLSGIANASGSVAALRQKQARTDKAKAAASKAAAAKKLAAKKAAEAAAAKKKAAAAAAAAKKKSGSGGGGGSSSGGGGGGSTYSASSSGSGSSGSGSSSSSKSTTDKTDYLKKAQDAVNLELQPQIDAIKRAMDKLTSQADASSTDAQTRGANTQSDLDAVYQRLDSYLKDRQAVGQEQYGQTAQAVDQRFAQQQGAMQQNSVNSNAAMQQELQRLGIAAPGQDYTARNQADDSFLAGLAGSNRAQAASSLGAQAANSNTVAGLLQGSSQASGTQQKGAASAALQTALTDIMRQRNEGVNDYNSQIAGIQGQSGKMVQQMLDAYESQAYQRQMDERQQNFENGMATNNFNLNVDKLNADTAYKATQASISKAKIAAQKEIAAMKNDSTANSSSKPNGGKYAMGSVGAMQFVNTMAPANLRVALTGAMRRIDQNSDPNAFDQTKYTSKAAALGVAAQYLADQGIDPRGEPSSWLAWMLDVYWGKYGS